MPTDTALISELLKAVGELSHELSDNGIALTDKKRIELVKIAEKLAIAAREPAENLYFQATQVRSSHNYISAKNLSYSTILFRQLKIPLSEQPSTWECSKRFPPAARV